MSKVKRILERSATTIKEEGLRSFGKKGINYVKLKTIDRPKKEDVFGDVLFINGCTLPHPSRYRVDHQIEQLLSSGLIANRVDYEQLDMNALKYYRAFVFFRCPITETVEAFIKKAKEYKKAVFFDIDDLVIDQKYTDTIAYLKTLSSSEKALYDDGVNRMQKTLKMCDYAITTTERLQKELKHYVKEVYINRNVASERMVELSKRAYQERQKNDAIVIGYLSGSITHNPDVEFLLPVLTKILDKYPSVQFKLVGEITIPKVLEKYQDRIIFEPFMNWEKLPQLISSLDINLAPLEESIFNEAKSENKWTEASLCHVVTVASDVGAFHQVIHHEEDGFLCKTNEDWEKVLSQLIEDASFRKQVAENAYNRVIQEYVTTYSGHGLATYIRSKLKRNIAFVLPTTNISGGVNVVLRHMHILRQHGYDVTIINMDKNEQDIVNKWGTFPVLKKNRLNVKGHFDSAVATLWATIDYVKKMPNVKHRFYLVQNFETDFADFGQFMRCEANATYEDDTGVQYITISKWCQNWLQDRFEKRSAYAPNGIDLEQFKIKERTFTGKIKILVEGNSDDYYKNVDESFRIVEKLDKEKYEIHFLSYQGEPKSWYYVDQFLHKVPYEEVGKVYQDADILIKSSKLESFSYPPLEMMATGGVVVVAPNDGNIEYLKDEENCLFYEPGNIDDALLKIEQLRTDENLRKKLIQNGLKTAKEREWSKIEKDIIALYDPVQ